jgi:hypothetical protein
MKFKDETNESVVLDKETTVDQIIPFLEEHLNIISQKRPLILHFENRPMLSKTNFICN